MTFIFHENGTFFVQNWKKKAPLGKLIKPHNIKWEFIRNGSSYVFPWSRFLDHLIIYIFIFFVI
jgi:hypothetical protein